MPSPVAISKPIFIVGCHRSGTTLLQRLLSQHPDCDILPETKLFAWLWSPWRGVAVANAETLWRHVVAAMPRINRAWGLATNASRMERLRDAIPCVPRRFDNVAHVMEFVLQHAPERLSDQTRVGEKTPLHIFHVKGILERFRDAKIVIAQRDLRAGVHSQGHRSHRHALSYRPFHDENYLLSWQSAVDLSAKYQRDYGASTVHVVQFEQLVSRPQATLQSLCKFVELPFSDQMLGVHFENSSFEGAASGIDPYAATRWKDEMPAHTRRQLESLSGPDLIRLGYTVSEKTEPISVIRHARLCAARWFMTHWPRSACYLGRDSRYRRFRRLRELPRPSIATHPRVMVLGNQKSGTTAIGRLLGEMGQLSTFIDLPRRMRRDGYALVRQQLTLYQFLQKYPECLSSELVKVPAFTFSAAEFQELLPDTHFLCIVRDPRCNIRSLLNRRRLRGDLEDLGRYRGSRTPRFDATIWGGQDENYVGRLAHRWNKAISSMRQLSNALFFRYEDFVADKQGSLQRIVGKLGIEPQQDISARVDVRFQPAGDHEVSWSDFFGEQNLSTIERICAEEMSNFGYVSSDDRSPGTDA